MLKQVLTVVLLFANLISFAQNLAQEVIGLDTVKGVNYFFDLPQSALSKAPKNSTIQSITTEKFNFNKQTVNLKADSAYWFKLLVKNDEDFNARFYIYSGYNDYVELYTRENAITTFVGRTGNLVPTPELQHKGSSKYVSFKIGAKKQLQLYLKIYNKGSRPVDLNLTIEDETTYHQEVLKYYQSVLKSTFVSVLFIGSLSFIFFFMTFLYLKSYQNIYLYYALYLLGSIIYALTRINNITWLGSLIDHYPLLREYLSEPIQFAFFAVYNYFVIELLNIKDTRLIKVLKRLSVAYLVYGVLHFLMMYIFFDYELRNTLFIISRSILFPLNIGLIIWVYKKVKSPILPYFLFGVFCYLSGALIAVMIDFRVQFIKTITIGLPSSNVFELGIMAEVLCFSLAVGYHIKLNEDEKRSNQLELIKQLQINQKLIENANEQLEHEVNIRSQKLMEASKEIEAKNLHAVKLSYDKKLAEAEMMALRSQMNPHFIFNSLNSVRYFMLSKQTDKAVNYLNKFSRLMRLVLEHSKNEMISLEEELLALDLYLGIEANRFSGQFNYEIKTNEQIELTKIMIPPLLLQPFVENAIWHGLLQSDKEQKQVLIEVDKSLEDDSECLVTISDNGIGYKKSASLKKNINKHKSLGISLTQERIKLFNDNFKGAITYRVEDIIERQQVNGTKVIFTLKLNT